MPISVDQVMQLLCHISEEKGMKAAVKHSGRGALLAGATAFLGGLVGGPPGIVVGAALGGLFAVWMTSGKFKPVSQIISQLPPAKKKKIYDEVVAIFKGLHWSDIAEVIALVKGSAELKQQLIKVLENYFKKHLNAEIQYGK